MALVIHQRKRLITNFIKRDSYSRINVRAYVNDQAYLLSHTVDGRLPIQVIRLLANHLVM